MLELSMNNLLSLQPDLPERSGKKRSGFSLVEVVIAMGIVSFAMVSMMGLIPVGLTTFHQAVDATVVAQIAQGVLNEAQLTPFDQLSDYSAAYDESGGRVEEGSPAEVYRASLTHASVTDSVTTHFSSAVATTLTVKIWSKAAAREPGVYTFVLVNNGKSNK